MFLFIFGLLSSCSQGGKHKVLSIFFDGVESSDTSGTDEQDRLEKASTPRAEQNLTTSKPQYYFHEVYEQKECGACHNNENSNKLVQEVPDLCYQCHTDFSQEYQVVHVPVAMGECGGCHHPHMAQHEKLLLDTIQKLCFACHEEEELRESETHREIGDTSCMNCHNPHGGENEYMFK